jgi:hypothetical protein
MEATIEKPYLHDFEGKNQTEIREIVHEINLVRCRTLGHLSALVLTTHLELKCMTWNGIDNNFDPDETYISVTRLKKIISDIEASVKDANELYSEIDGSTLINLR